tara:strand:+ start:1548 stop:2048 length:501 start_codon:yes stop_codon:yes gene_type:complete
MAEENQVEEGQTEGSEEGGQPKKKKANVLVIAIILLSVLLISLGGYLLMPHQEEEPVEEVAVAPAPSVFYEMPEMIVSLSGNSSNIRYLKLVLSLEIATPEDQVIVEGQMPKITDEFQTYLRQLRLEDLRGSVGTYRLKESLLLRVNQVVQPVEVKDVLLKEMLVQ